MLTAALVFALLVSAWGGLLRRAGETSRSPR